MHIVQIAPQIAPGSGVAMVAYALEREFAAAGVRVERFTLEEARGRPAPGPRSRLEHAWDVVWFSTIGTARARRFLAERASAVAICHNDAMAGDIYVNHGLLKVAMRARGHYAWRMIRNPLHMFTAMRDRIRYRGHAHRAIVVLTSREAELLAAQYPHLHAPITVIGNGVDLHQFRPPTADERIRSRRELPIPTGAYVAAFIANEFDRKGLPVIIDALATVTGTVLLVVGGSAAMIASARAQAESSGVADRVAFVGAHRDVVPYFHAADVFVMPSAYESSGLVFLESLACGVPIVATPVGCAPDVINDRNGRLVHANANDVAARIIELRDGNRDEQREAARASALPLGWPDVARAYLRLAEQVQASR